MAPKQTKKCLTLATVRARRFSNMKQIGSRALLLYSIVARGQHYRCARRLFRLLHAPPPAPRTQGYPALTSSGPCSTSHAIFSMALPSLLLLVLTISSQLPHGTQMYMQQLVGGEPEGPAVWGGIVGWSRPGRPPRRSNPWLRSRAPRRGAGAGRTRRKLACRRARGRGAKFDNFLRFSVVDTVEMCRAQQVFDDGPCLSRLSFSTLVLLQDKRATSVYPLLAMRKVSGDTT